MPDIRALADLTFEEKEAAQMCLAARQRAYCPYSRFKVGAALICEDGAIFTGVNVENSSYGATICAERSALVAAVSTGHLRFQRIYIAAEATSTDFISPCGICRQFMSEFGDFEVLLVRPSDRKVLFTSVHELLPLNLDQLQHHLVNRN